MREILFRGKIKYNGSHLFCGDWVEGSLVIKTHGYFIYVIEEDEFGNIVREFEVEVIPETVCQYTGLTDKNGVEIFEGDILFVPKYEHTQRKVRCLVEWDELNLSFTTFSPRSSFFVLGNKFDNPELLNE